MRQISFTTLVLLILLVVARDNSKVLKNVLKDSEAQLATFTKKIFKESLSTFPLKVLNKFVETMAIPLHLCYLCPDVHPERLDQFTLPPTVNEKEDFPTSQWHWHIIIRCQCKGKKWHLMDVVFNYILLIVLSQLS